jgi:hypothetical protein
MVSSLCGYDPAREKAPDAPLLALGLFREAIVSR